MAGLSDWAITAADEITVAISNAPSAMRFIVISFPRTLVHSARQAMAGVRVWQMG